MKLNKKIRVGTAGVEARLFLVKGFRHDVERSDKDGKRTPQETLRIAGDDLDDVLAHMRKFEKDFDIYSVRLVGMVVVASGTAYSG